MVVRGLPSLAAKQDLPESLASDSERKPSVPCRAFVLGEKHSSETGVLDSHRPRFLEAGPGVISVLIFKRQQTNLLGKEVVQLFFINLYLYIHVHTHI